MIESLKQRLRLVFSINSDGQLSRIKKTSNCCRLGAVSTLTDGYLCTSFEGTRRLAHHIVWAMHYGEWPSGGDIDHINRVRSDNRLCNLRLVNRSTNCHNTIHHKDARVPVKGVDYVVKRNKYRARICIAGKYKQLGYFNTADAAGLALLQYRSEHAITNP